MRIQWMIRRDLPRVLEIEKLCYRYPWSEKDFVNYLTTKMCVGFTVSIERPSENYGRSDLVVGYMIYLLETKRLNLVNIAIHPEYQRQGFGKALIKKLINKMEQSRRNAIRTMTHECNLGAQLFLKKMGFKANFIKRGVYKLGGTEGAEGAEGAEGSDGYCFSYVPPISVEEKI